MSAKVIIPSGKVSFRNLRIDAKKMTFSVEYAVLEGRKRKFIYQEASGVITTALRDWLTKGFYPKDASGSVADHRTTAFRLHLQRIGVDWKEGILPTLQWESSNTSQVFDECPFKLTLSDRFQPSFDLVYRNAKQVESVSIDPNTGREWTNWKEPMFRNQKRERFVRFRRFENVQQEATV